MPFIEIKPPTNFIRIKKNGTLTISIPLYEKYFKGKKVKIFHDTDNKRIGFQPMNDGYLIFGLSNHCARIHCAFISRIVTGEFYPKWSKKHKMLIITYCKS